MRAWHSKYIGSSTPQNYTATIIKLSGNEESDDNTFKVTFKRGPGDIAPMDVGAVGSSRNQKRGVSV